MKKTYSGSCHCGRVTFEADIDLSAGTSKCNCTLCWKRRWWAVQLKPADFRAVTGAEELTPYPRKAESGPRGFCKHCGIAPYVFNDAASWNDGVYVSVNLACLDELGPTELAEAPVQYLDGRADSWAAPAETRHL